MKKIKIALVQKKLGMPVTKSDAIELKKSQPHFICFPEYFFINKKFEQHKQTIHNFKRELKRVETISRYLKTVIIGGTMLEPEEEKIYNTSYIFNRGKLIGSYRKQNLFNREQGKITPGNELKIFTAYGIRFGIIICADVFIHEYFVKMKGMGAKLIFIPTFSPKKDETTEEKYKRDNDIFVKGARIADAVIVKVCGVRSEFKENLQARSLIADKNGIIYRVRPDEEETEMIIMKELRI